VRPDSRNQCGVRAAVEHRPDAREGRSDPGIVGRVDDVARECETKPDTEARPVHRRDRRHRESAHSRYQGVGDTLQDRLAVLVVRVGFGEVTPAAEGPSFTPNQERPCPTGLRRVKAVGELAEHGGAQGVHLVGPVEHQLGNAALDGQADRAALLRFRHMAPAPWR
jgi:hypothetical protein